MYTDEQLKLLEHWAQTGEQREAEGALPLLPRFDLFGPRGPALVVLTLLGHLRLLRADLGAMERHNKRLVDDLHAAEENLRDRVMLGVIGYEMAGVALAWAGFRPIEIAEEAARRAYAVADAVLSQRNGKPPEKP
jgi:hypothetical protein